MSNIQSTEDQDPDDARASLTAAFRPKAWFYIPLRHGGKKPLEGESWKALSTSDPETIARWIAEGHNLGVDCEKSGLTVIDTDGGQVGEDALAALERERGAIGETYTIDTPHGVHRYFEGVTRSSVTKLGDKVDTRSAGGYVVAPGSIVGGRPYALRRKIKPLPVPDWIAPALAVSSERQPAAVGELDLPQNIARAIAELKQRVPVHQGQGADAATYAVAALLRDFGVSTEKSIELMLEHYKCWPQDERYAAFIQRKVENAFAYAQNEAGAKGIGTAGEAFADYLANLPQEPTAAAPAEAGSLAFETLDSLLASPPTPVAEIVGGLVEKHVFTTLSGPGGSHKSRLGLQLGLCVSAGIPALGRAVERCAFVFLSYEDPREEIVRRVHALAARLKLPTTPDPKTGFHYLNRAGRPEPLLIVREDADPEVTDFGRQVIDALRALPRHKLLLIDGTYNAVRFVGKAKINEDAVMTAIGWFDALCTAADCTIVSLWHPSQAGQEREDASGWSVAWHNRPRARLAISGVKGQEDTFELKVVKRNHGPKGQPITLHWSAGALLPRGETDAAESAGRLVEACIASAIAAAAQGAPLTMQKTPPKWVYDDVEQACGYRPTRVQIKETLAQALRNERLRYVRGTSYRAAGYYPFAQDEAEALAAEAKRQHAAAKDTIGLA